MYEHEKRVYGISGYKFSTSGNIKESSFFLPIMSSWGYGIWKDRWEKVSFDEKKLLDIVDKKRIGKSLNFGYLDFYQMLKDKVNGENDSWAIRFYVSMFLRGGVFLYPQHSLLQNIGFDGSGVHCGYEENLQTEFPQEAHANLKLKKKKPILEKQIIKMYSTKKQNIVFQTLKILTIKVKHRIKLKREKLLKAKKAQILRNTPRKKDTRVLFDGKHITVPDYASYYFMCQEIYEKEIYKFHSITDTPFIIDAGANIGLASIYLKKMYPEAEIIAFEPDPSIHKYLIANLKTFDFSDIKAINKGVWDKETTLNFTSDGADGGFVSGVNNFNKPNKSIEVISLKKYLNRKVDFLKLDIEGAETIVLKDIRKELSHVDRIFVEYHSFINMPQTLDEIISILTESGFRIYVNTPGLTSKAPFSYIRKYNKMDLQLNIFGIKSDLL